MSGTTLRKRFEEGLSAGRDPASAAALSGGVAVTNLRSPWLQRPCARCGHTFRRGDRVEPSEPARAGDGGGRGFVHAGDTPFCNEGISNEAHVRGDLPNPPGEPPQNEAEPSRIALRAAFYTGLERAFPPPEGAPVVRLEPGHPLLAPPSPAFARASCAVCGHSFRPYDQVVICPCSPEQPLCASAVHRDPMRAMMCWDEWKKSHLAGFCPATSRRLAP